MAVDYQDIQHELRKRPFEPFRILLTDGKTYDVSHPERILVGKRSYIFGVVVEGAGQGNGETAYDRYETIAMLHVVRLEPLPHAQKA